MGKAGHNLRIAFDACLAEVSAGGSHFVVLLDAGDHSHLHRLLQFPGKTVQFSTNSDGHWLQGL